MLFWSGIIGLEDDGKDKEKLDEVVFSPMSFVSGKFSGPSLNWSVSDKELYPLLAMTKKFNYMLEGHPSKVKVFCDHLNIVYLLHPPSSVRTVTMSRLFRWTMLLQSFPSVVYHVEGESNRLADTLSRWGFLGGPDTKD